MLREYILNVDKREYIILFVSHSFLKQKIDCYIEGFYKRIGSLQVQINF